MGQTKIEWTATRLPDGTVIPGYSWNPWLGCSRVSAGCTHCYAERMDSRTLWGGRTHWGTAPRARTSAANWQEPLRWDRKAQAEGIRRRVFCASLADVFEDRPEVVPWRADLWDLIEKTPNLDWLILTKRPENIYGALPDRWLFNLPRHIWFGTSAEDQATLEKRWPELDGATHAYRPAVLFLSLEPLLGPIDLGPAFEEQDYGDEEHSWWSRPVDWVIAGGESGPGARPMHPDWVRSIRNQCQDFGVPFFFKQWGAWQAIQFDHRGEGDILFSPKGMVVERLPEPFANTDEFRRIAAMREVGKKAAGRLLDGLEWNEVPVLHHYGRLCRG